MPNFKRKKDKFRPETESIFEHLRLSHKALGANSGFAFYSGSIISLSFVAKIATLLILSAPFAVMNLGLILGTAVIVVGVASVISFILIGLGIFLSVLGDVPLEKNTQKQNQSNEINKNPEQNVLTNKLELEVAVNKKDDKPSLNKKDGKPSCGSNANAKMYPDLRACKPFCVNAVSGEPALEFDSESIHSCSPIM